MHAPRTGPDRSARPGHLIRQPVSPFRRIVSVGLGLLASSASASENLA
jgi:hypothetical protein